MSSPSPAAASTGIDEALRGQGELLLAREAFGRSRSLERLFRFLLACSLERRVPKELEIAEEVFGRSADTHGEQDASIRVHVHRLRRKIDDFYAGPGAGERVRLTIPKGGYRLVALSADAVPETPEEPVARVSPGPPRRWAELGAVLAMMALVAGATWWFAKRGDSPDTAFRTAQRSALWAPVTGNGRRIVIVVGDYYIFGERDAEGTVARLIREFDINSPAELERMTAGDADRSARYVDLGLEYLPVGVGDALRVVAPLLRRNDDGLLTTLVVPASRVSPDMVRSANLVYLGYLSGLASLRDPTFAGSRFAIGASYDEIVDRRTGRAYVAGSRLERDGKSPTRDYALIASFPGVSGNRVVVIAGTRDAALMQAADFATRPESLGRLAALARPGAAFEALLSVDSLDQVGLRARLITASARPRDADWSGRPSQSFPDDDATR